MTDAAGSPSTARDRAIEVVTEELDQHAGSAADAAEWAVAALCTVPGLLRALAGEAEPTPADADERLDDVQGWLHEQNEATDGPMYARTLGLVQDQAPELERLKWERDMALSRVAAAEEVQCRMGESLPASGPVDSWSERDRAVRDYEGDLSTALATEDDTVGERLREVERERDEARAVLAQRDEFAVGTIAAVQKLCAAAEYNAAELERMRPVVEAVEVWNDKWMAGEAGVSAGTELHNVLVKYLARDHAAVYRAGGSAPHQGATTDATAPAQHPEGEAACTICKGHGIVTDPGYYVPGEQFVEPPSEDMCNACAGTGASHVQRLVSQRTAVLARLDAIESNDTFRRILSGYLPSTIFTSEVRALLGAGETTEETHD